MKILAYILGIDKKLALAELKAVFETFSEESEITETEGQSAVLEVKNPGFAGIKKRLALSHGIYEFLGKSEVDNPGHFFGKKDIEIEMPFRVRAHFTDRKPDRDVKELERKCANRIWRNSESRGMEPSVDLKNPKTCIDLFVEDKAVYIGKKLFDIDKKQFALTDSNKRPFRRPITMGSRTARLMINLAQVREGKILDPFCGTGAILIEAGMVGLYPYGIDIKEDLIEGAKKNIAHFGLNAGIREGDARKLHEMFPENHFDAVVTDPPYGISASMGNVRQGKLYNEALSSIENVLKPDHLAVIATPGEINLKTNMKLLAMHKERLSTNLVRHIYIFRKVS